MKPNETLVSKKGLRATFLLSLQRHHQWLFIFGLFQIGLAVVISSLSWTTKEQIILPESNEVYSHPPLIILFIALLLVNALVFASISATHGAFWFRFVITSIVTFLLLVFGWMIGAFPFIVLPVVIQCWLCFLAGFTRNTGSANGKRYDYPLFDHDPRVVPCCCFWNSP